LANLVPDFQVLAPTVSIVYFLLSTANNWKYEKDSLNNGEYISLGIDMLYFVYAQVVSSWFKN
jgi:hypothetical protein